MKKLALMLVGMGMASAFAGASTQSADSSCASPKFLFQGSLCDSLNTMTDSARLFVTVSLLHTVPDSMNSPAYLAKIKVWSESLFTKYDLRNFQDTLTRLPVPPDSEISWGYSFLFMTKATMLALVNETYVQQLEVRTSPPSTLIFFNTTGKAKRGNMPEGTRVDALGRGIMRTNRSMNSFVKPSPKL